jgi:hypothetical protein
VAELQVAVLADRTLGQAAEEQQIDDALEHLLLAARDRLLVVLEHGAQLRQRQVGERVGAEPRRGVGGAVRQRLAAIELGEQLVELRVVEVRNHVVGRLQRQQIAHLDLHRRPHLPQAAHVVERADLLLVLVGPALGVVPADRQAVVLRRLPPFADAQLALADRAVALLALRPVRRRVLRFDFTSNFRHSGGLKKNSTFFVQQCFALM